MTGWYETTDSRTVHRGYAEVRIETVVMPDGEAVEREIVAHDDAVAVVAIDDEDRIVLVKQYRQAVRAYVLEIPAGKIDEVGESPEETARRELAEEVELQAASWQTLTTFLNSAGWTDERTHVFLARELQQTSPPEGFSAAHEEADMEVVRIPFDEALTLVRAGELTDAKTVIGILLAAPSLGR